MANYSIPQLESLCQRLPITAANAGIFLALLQLPYDLYRPIMDLLFAGLIFPEDLADSPQNTVSGASLVAASNAAGTLLAQQQDLNIVGTAAFASRVQQILATIGLPANLGAPGGTEQQTAAAQQAESSSPTLLVGGPAAAVVLPVDLTAFGLATPQETLTDALAPSKAFAPAAFTALSYDAMTGFPNAIQVLRANGFAAAQKMAANAFAGVMNPKVF